MELSQGYKQTEVGLVPLDWEVLPLEAVTSFISYGFTNPMPTADSGVYMITAKDISKGKIQYESARCTTEEAYRSLLTAKSRPIRGDLLLTKDGTLGRLAVVDETLVCINQSVAILRPNSRIVVEFLKALLESSPYQKRMLEDAGGSTIKHIYITIVNRMPIGVPPTLSEQRAIAEALSDVDALIQSLEQLITKKRQIKQGATHELLTAKRRLAGFEGDWIEKAIGEVLKSYHLGGNYANGESETAYPLMKMGNVGRGEFNTEKVEYIASSCVPDSQDRLGYGDVLLNTRNTLELVGKVAIWRDELSVAYFNSNLLRLEFDPLSVGSQFFMNLLMNSASVIRQLREVATGTTSVAAIYTRDLLKIRLQMPGDRNEQKAIALVVESMVAEIYSLELKLRKVRQIKQGMMQELLTGRIRLV